MAMQQSNNNRGPIPNRWIGCPRKSDTIIADRFIAFKTPLSSAFHNQMDIQDIFTPEMMLSYCKTIKLKVGLWIDLTNTNRFYDRSVVESQGIRYVKLQCRGHGETPSPEQTRSFIEIVEEFVKEHPMDIVAVHCTHGFNRTGFLIASYLIERSDFAVDAAVGIFAAARHPGIYKQEYINELYQRYESEEDPLQAPPMPQWGESNDLTSNNSRKRSYNESIGSSNFNQHNGGYSNTNGQHEDNDLDEDDQVDDGNDDGGEYGNSNNQNNQEATNANNGRPTKKRRRERLLKNATFMEGVPMVNLVTDQPRLGELQLKVQQMCGWERNGFPGSQPVSMDIENIKRLHEIPYMVSWKADGTRYMMLIDGKDNVYFFDRNFSCFQAENITFLKPGNLQEHLKDTLVDGEMVLDKFEGKTIPRYLIYDVIKFENQNIGQEPFSPHRLRCIKKQIIGPRIEAITKGIINRDLEPFGIRNKEFWDLPMAKSLLSEKFVRSLLHDPDGLIFQPALMPYVAGNCPDVFKWKPHELNSVDFRLKITTETGLGILTRKIGMLCVGHDAQPFAHIELTRELRQLDNKIVECTLTRLGKWELLRERTDKIMPNSYDTAQSVFKSIRTPVTKDYLLEFINMYGFRGDSNLKPAPPQSINHNPQQQHPNQFKPPMTRY